MPTDVGKPEPVRLAFAEAEARFVRLDLLFNNAGSFTPGIPMEELTYAQWQQSGGADDPVASHQAMPKGVPLANRERVPEPVMDVEHVVRAVFQLAQLPLDTNVQFMTIMATRMPFIGRG